MTGASSGIGAAIAVRLADAGARLILHGQDGARLAAMAERTGGVPLPADFSCPAALLAAIEQALQHPGGVDVLVNNAGIGWAGRLGEMTGDQVRRLVAVNLLAPLELTRALVPGMVAKGHGHIVFVTSIAGRSGVAGEAVYAATKAGLDAFADSLRFELAGTGVHVGVVVPGVVDTPFFTRRGRPYARARPRPVPPERVADAVLRAISRTSAELYVPRWLRLPVALRGVSPAVYRALAGRFGGSE
ncbi:MAG: SDR family NAD(P)-dependent oxidoreductase [Sciscionella sp.]